MKIGHKIRSARKAARLTQADLADKCGYPNQSRVSGYETDEREPSLQDLEAIAKAVGLKTIGELLDFNENKVVEPATNKDLIEIPRLAVHGSMGPGLIRPYEYEDVVERMSVSRDWLRRNVMFSNPDNLALISAYGDSMAGTFNDGDMLLVDTGINDIKVDAIYVLALNDELFIKRLQRRPDGAFLMISDNKNYEPYEIPKSDISSFSVLGRVLLAWNANKL